MKLRNLIFVLALVAAFSAALIFQQKDTVPTITSSPPLIGKPVAQVTDEKIPKVEDHTPVDGDAIKDRYLGELQADRVRHMLNYGLDDKFTEAEIDLYNSLHILPFNPVVQVDCPPIEEMYHESLKQMDVQIAHQKESPDAPDLVPESICPNVVFEQPMHRYGDLSEDELRELAYDDAVAALFMGIRSKKTLDTSNSETANKRFAEDEARTQWFVRAAALSEKSGPIMMLIETRYSDPSGPNEFIQRIALEISAEYMGDPRAQPEVWRKKLKEHVALYEGEIEKQYAEDLAYADAWAEIFMNYAALVQTEIKGSTNLLDRGEDS